MPKKGSLAACLDRLAANPRFALLSEKMAVGTFTNTSTGILADTSFASNNERKIISEWAAARGECIRVEASFGNATYRPPLQAFGLHAENKVMAATVALYNREISFGEFNRQQQAIADQLREKEVTLSRQIQMQRTSQQLSDREAREREQTRREIEEAELQATLARQQAQSAQENAARLPSISNRRDWPRGYRPAPTARYGNCFRFGSRITCTGW